MRRRGSTTDRYPALAASALLHAAVLVAGMVAFHFRQPLKVQQVTPVTLLTSAQIANLRAAVEAQTPQEAQTETPVAQAPPEPPAPTPAPAPPAPAPAPKVEPPKPSPPQAAKPAEQPAKTPQKPAPAKPSAAAGLDLDALAASIAKSVKAGGAKPSSAHKGPTRAEADVQARQASGAARAATADALSAIAGKLTRLWNPNCGVEGAANIIIPVRITLRADGGLVRADLADARRIDDLHDPVERAAAIRALNAVSRAAPFDGLPAETYSDWKAFVVRFNAKQACQGM
ncbi:MAG: energy transducer TonB [Caulobacteraceae bacterium]|nr:energy transducer TonB [Caulobacteraceae bacterium]